ncbi:hypothetical protein BH11ARM2_BH11ARM2_27140 [soil metagenome]
MRGLPDPQLGQGLPSYFGSVGEGQAWQEAVHAYNQDRVKEAFGLADSLGAGFGGASLAWYRVIEAEAEAREASHIVEITPNLRLEAVDPEASADLLSESLEAVVKLAGEAPTVPILVTILLPEADAPWHQARYGYMVPKEGLAKVCLPAWTLEHPEGFGAVARHELMHVAVTELTGDRAPEWLQEGMAQVAEGRSVPDGVEPWLSPEGLRQAFHVDRRDPTNLGRNRAAYAQALRLVGHLCAERDQGCLTRLLGAFTDNSWLTELRIRMGLPPIDEALQEVYGFDERALFEKAR